MAISDWFDFDFDFSGIMELDMVSIGVSLLLYSIFMLMIWRGWGSGNWTLSQKVMITILLLPISYIMTAWQLNK